MSENMRKSESEGDENSRRGANKNDKGNVSRQDKSFDGMNYEQRRGPYNPPGNAGSRRDDTGGGNNSGKRRDEI